MKSRAGLLGTLWVLWVAGAETHGSVRLCRPSDVEGCERSEQTATTGAGRANSEPRNVAAPDDRRGQAHKSY